LVWPPLRLGLAARSLAVDLRILDPLWRKDP